MNLKGIVSIAGKPGLYKIVAQSKNTLIVESLEDNKRMPTQPTHRVSALENISIYTYTDDIPLLDIYTSIAHKENGGKTLSHKESEEKLVTYLEEILPEYDKSRVYLSDIKKLFQWYNILQQADLITTEKEEIEEKETKEEENTPRKSEEEE